jgi:histidinol-phosphate aminotransferase
MESRSLRCSILGRIIAPKPIAKEAAMTEFRVSRRQFAVTMGAAAAAALTAPKLLESVAHASLPDGMPESTIQLDSNENPYGPSPKALDAITGSERVASRYPDGVEERVYKAIARLHGVDVENVALGCGSTEILRAADMAFLGPGKQAVAAEPTFEAVLAFARIAHAGAVKVPLTSDFRHDLPRMAATCTSKTGLVYVCNPNNPTGTIVSRGEMADFFPRVPSSTVILVDEAYHHFVEDPRYSTAFEWFGKLPNLVIARTFSKIYGMAGMRLGYGVGPKDLIAQMQRHLMRNSTNAAVLPAAIASLNDPDHVPRQKKLLNGTRDWLVRELTKDGRETIPSQANFFMVDVGGDVHPIIEKFRDRGILVGRKFPSLGNWLRISIGTQKEMEAFLAALREIVPAGVARAARAARAA